VKPAIVAEIAQGKTRNLSFGGYTWRVLEVRGNQVLLLAEDIVEKRAYHTALTDVTWETCALRAYLNGEFYDSFSAEDKARIALTRNDNPDNTWKMWCEEIVKTPGGSATDDRVFLLSVQEVLKYFPGLQLHKDSDEDEFDEFEDYDEWYYGPDERLVVKSNDVMRWWWLRSPGYAPYYAVCVNSAGYVCLGGNNVNYMIGGLRPALWLTLP